MQRFRYIWSSCLASAILVLLCSVDMLQARDELEEMQEDLDQLENELESLDDGSFEDDESQYGPREEESSIDPDDTNDAEDNPGASDEIVEANYVRLDVPVVRQPQAPLCGAASIEMVFRYWGETRYDQYAIAKALAERFSDSDRYREFGHHIAGRSASDIDWTLYPGTGTYYMREFLERYAATDNKRIRRLPSGAGEARAVRDEFFEHLKQHLRNGIPVIVHQDFSATSDNGHYRVVTGFDDSRRIVFLNDPRPGAITQGYDQFLSLWNVDEEWLPYNSIAFNLRKMRLHINSL